MCEACALYKEMINMLKSENKQLKEQNKTLLDMIANQQVNQSQNDNIVDIIRKKNSSISDEYILNRFEHPHPAYSNMTELLQKYIMSDKIKYIKNSFHFKHNGENVTCTSLQTIQIIIENTIERFRNLIKQKNDEISKQIMDNNSISEMEMDYDIDTYRYQNLNILSCNDSLKKIATELKKIYV
jgi:hypothetical protein